MKSSILISNKPKRVANILNGEQTIIILKTAPKEWTDYLSGKTNKKPEPKTGYIYCTEPHAKEVLSLFVAEVRQYYGGRVAEFIERKCVDNPGMRWSICNGKVAAKFTLSAVTCMCLEQPYLDYYAKKACVSVDDVIDYQMHPIASKLYAWHISDLVIFDKPKELSDFRVLDETIYHIPTGIVKKTYKAIKRPPHSWRYIETAEEKKLN